MALFDLFKKTPRNADYIIVVSGLPRSGTSMMMQILQAGGIEPVTDNIRQADRDNSKGYYEHELVKALVRGNQACLANAQGKAIKVVSTLLRYLSKQQQYKIIFMHRELEQVLASQKQMLNNLNSDTQQDNDAQLKQFYTQHLDKISVWLDKIDNVEVLHLAYVDLLNQPKPHIERLTKFLGANLNKRKMCSVIDTKMRHH